jgi:hypothetical protein
MSTSHPAALKTGSASELTRLTALPLPPIGLINNRIFLFRDTPVLGKVGTRLVSGETWPCIQLLTSISSIQHQRDPSVDIDIVIADQFQLPSLQSVKLLRLGQQGNTDRVRRAESRRIAFLMKLDIENLVYRSGQQNGVSYNTALVLVC